MSVGLWDTSSSFGEGGRSDGRWELDENRLQSGLGRGSRSDGVENEERNVMK